MTKCLNTFVAHCSLVEFSFLPVRSESHDNGLCGGSLLMQSMYYVDILRGYTCISTEIFWPILMIISAKFSRSHSGIPCTSTLCSSRKINIHTPPPQHTHTHTHRRDWKFFGGVGGFKGPGISGGRVVVSMSFVFPDRCQFSYSFM